MTAKEKSRGSLPGFLVVVGQQGYERWQQLDFVVGIRVVRSNNHPEVDICDELSAPNGSSRSTGKGCYPKDFKFTGWHPQCRCHVETIMKTQREMADDTQRILRGEKPTTASVNTVAAMPEEFTAWVNGNKGRILEAEQRGTLPYFISDNRAAVDNILNPKPKELTTLEKAELRHKARTQAEIDDIRRRAQERYEMMHYADGTPFSIEQLKQFKELEKSLAVTRGKPMTAEDADRQRANPRYISPYNWYYDETRDKQYTVNCQTCVPAYVLRLAGYDVAAKGNTPGSLSEYLSYHPFEAWLNIDGSKTKPTLYCDWMRAKGYTSMTKKRYREFFNECCKEEGVYEIALEWKSGGGHATVLQRFKDGTLAYIEPQVFDKSQGARRSIDSLCEEGASRPCWSFGVLRVDNKVFNLKYASVVFNKRTY